MTDTPAYEAGRQAALDGDPISRCPWDHRPGAPERDRAIAWRKGFHAGEAEQAEGQHFKTRR